MLLNPIYIGKVRWNYRKEVKNLVDGKLVTSRPRHRNDPCLLYDGKHEAIIDDITFHKVASRVRSDKTKGGLKLRNSLAGILICAKCKKAMAYQPYDYKPSTNPRFMHAPSVICKIKSVAEKDVMDALVYALNLYIDDFKMIIDDRPSVDENNNYGVQL